jgi:uncharacterized membrane protein YgdD (TMEM256/DUF423 family)
MEGDANVVNVFIILAGVMGMAGIGLVAAAAHAATGMKLEPAGYLLLLHAAAVLAGTAALDRDLIYRSLGLLGLAGFVAGAALFSGDLSLRAFAGFRLFPLAAPIGGLVLMASWFVIALGGGIVLARGS